MTARNIRSGWSGAGLFPSNPDRVLASMEVSREAPVAPPPPPQEQTFSARRTLMTPTTSEGVHAFYYMLEAKLEASGTANDPYLQKLLQATEKASADHSLLYDENEGLTECEKHCDQPRQGEDYAIR